MQYKMFGKTGISISALGFGAMRLPEYEKDGKWFIKEEEALQMIHRGFDLGINYIDTAFPYLHGNSEFTVGKALKGYRNRINLATKMPTWLVKEKGDYRRFLEEQLKKLDVEYIDFYYFHGLNNANWTDTVQKLDLLEEAEKAKQDGLIKHISFSFHDKPEVLKMLVDTGAFETLLCQYNLLDRANEDAIAYAHEKGMGTVIMGPIAGGRLAAPSEVIAKSVDGKINSTPEIALRFVLGNPNVSCALSGMSSITMVEENAKVASIEEPLSKADWMRINAAMDEVKRLADLYCTGCDYCMPCPKGIRIPEVFKIMNQHRVYGLTETAKREFGSLGKDSWHGKSPADCIECGVCETKCPQKIEIRERLKETLRELGD